MKLKYYSLIIYIVICIFLCFDIYGQEPASNKNLPESVRKDRERGIKLLIIFKIFKIHIS
jgi:hypothetical protein